VLAATGMVVWLRARRQRKLIESVSGVPQAAE
jgi:hypothetical protein